MSSKLAIVHKSYTFMELFCLFKNRIFMGKQQRVDLVLRQISI